MGLIHPYRRLTLHLHNPSPKCCCVLWVVVKRLTIQFLLYSVVLILCFVVDGVCWVVVSALLWYFNISLFLVPFFLPGTTKAEDKQARWLQWGRRITGVKKVIFLQPQVWKHVSGEEEEVRGMTDCHRRREKVKHIHNLHHYSYTMIWWEKILDFGPSLVADDLF